MWSPHCPVLSSVLVFLLSACLGGEKGSAAPAAQAVVFTSRIWDVNQKSLYLQNNELLAGYLQGPNSALEEKIFWAHSRAFDRERFPIILSIQDGKQCLASSSGSSMPPVLHLEKANLTDLCMESKEKTSRFTFFRSYQDGLWQFESAAHPGWFLCTSAGANEPLGLTQGTGSGHVLDFYFQLC
ncbi:hypothetical protein lerEdw1_019841 [Lerista edwardsae]|nr:hypothetical protein lerEdw1_019841 [Lerista edwardsae]